jgi:sugar phosphate isomerase/epimerase
VPAISRRVWWIVAVAVVLAAAAATTLVLVRRHPAPRARQYRSVDVCLLTGAAGVADPQAAEVWAGMRDASLATRVRVSYLPVVGAQTQANALPFAQSLIQRHCRVILAVGAVEVAAAAAAAPSHQEIRFVLIGQGPAGGNVSVLAGGERVRPAVAEVVSRAVGGWVVGEVRTAGRGRRGRPGRRRSDVTIWALSGFGDEIDPDPVVALAVLQALGARHLEVRSAWGVNVVELTDAQLDRLAALIAARGMAVSAVASPIGKVDVFGDPGPELARLRRAVAAAHRLDAGYLRLFSFYRPAGVPAAAVRDLVLRRMRGFAEVAERERLVLVHENEKAIYGDVPQRVLDLVESVGSAALRVAWDSANFVQVGVRPFTEGYRLLRPYLEYLQVKDAVAETGAVVPAGEGDGELRETLAALRADGYTGFASLEPHLAHAHDLGGFSGPAAFGRAARAFAALTGEIGVQLA